MMSPRKTTLTFDDVAALAGKLPQVDVSTSYGTPALKVKGKMFARMWEDGLTLVLKSPFVVRDHLIATKPAVFYLTEHYRDYPYVLVRLNKISPTMLRAMLEEAWRQAAPKRLLVDFEKAP